MVLAGVQQGLRIQCCGSDEESSAAKLLSASPLSNTPPLPQSLPASPLIRFPHVPSLRPCLYPVWSMCCAPVETAEAAERGNIYISVRWGLVLLLLNTHTLPRQSLLQELQHTGRDTASHIHTHLSHTECKDTHTHISIEYTHSFNIHVNIQVQVKVQNNLLQSPKSRSRYLDWYTTGKYSLSFLRNKHTYRFTQGALFTAGI